jgi:hypothetical protein
MKTDTLIDLLAADAAPVDPRGPARRVHAAVALGLGAAVLWILGAYGARPDLAAVWTSGPFLLKAGFTAAVAVTAAVAAWRSGHPGWDLGAWRWAWAAPVLLVWALALGALAQAGAGERAALVLGSTWRTCALNVALAALPAWLALGWALRTMAPTRPALTGALAGWAAGGVGALAYSLHCPEVQTPFLGVWYVAGMALPAAAGAWAGPRWLRW